MRLIDLDKLLEFPIRENHYDRENGNIRYIFGIEAVLEYAESLPTVDAVQVVRCKDCKRSQYDKLINERWCNGKVVEDDDFCSYGERKDDE